MIPTVSMKKSPLRRASKKYAKELRMYASLKKFILRERPYCECPSRNGPPSCMNRATDIHHMKGRGKMLNVVEFWLAVCNDCHAWIHANTKEARAKGLVQ